MNHEKFILSLSAEEPPTSIHILLKALWFAAKEDWDRAHTIVQDIENKDSSWVHAYLHRKEGDPSNARYWYTLAGKPFPKISLDEEWKEIVIELLKRKASN